MAASAETLMKMFKLLGKTYGFTVEDAVNLLAPKGYLPKKLTETPKLKEVSRFASVQASNYAAAHPIEIPTGFKGTAKHGKISMSDLKALTAPKKIKQNITPSARAFVERNDEIKDKLSTIVGTGVDGKIKLIDVQRLKPQAEDRTEDALATKSVMKRKYTPEAKNLMRHPKNRLDEEALDEVKLYQGTGEKGKITKDDLKPIIRALRADEKENPSDSYDTEDSMDEDED